MKGHTASIQFNLVIFLMTIATANCRQWQSIIDYDIVHKSNIDSSRYELKIEADPFFSAEDKSSMGIPSESPKAVPNNFWTTTSPTSATSWSSTSWSSSSTLSPMKFFPELNNNQNDDTLSSMTTESSIEHNVGCENGHKLYEVHMMDTWGDGWDQTVITITELSDQNPSSVDIPTDLMTTTHTDNQGDMIVSISETIDIDSTSSSVTPNSPGQIFQGSLNNGYHESVDVCLLSNRCYQLIAAGGEFLEEVSWEISPGNNDPESPLVSMELVLSGGAPTECTFSIPDENGVYLCPNVCSAKPLPNSTTEPPYVVEKLQQNEDEVAAEAADLGHTQTNPATGTLDEEMKSNTFVTQSVSRPEGSDVMVSSLWNKLADTHEHSSN